MTAAPQPKSPIVKRRTVRSIGPKVLVKANVRLWGDLVGAVMEFENGRIGFSYDRQYILDGGPSISPQFLPVEERTFEFPQLSRLEAFMGLPGVLADSLPDTFGNLIIRKFFETRGQKELELSPVQRLLYVGKRAMGALEYTPALQQKSPQEDLALEVKSLVESARKLIEGETGHAIQEIMRVGGSAGGARPKALILWDRKKKKVRSGFARQRSGEEHWLIKFDDISSTSARDNKGKPFNRIEYTYALLADRLDIDIEEVDYLEDAHQFHFLMRRFDRKSNMKVHMHSLAGMTHIDFNMPGVYDYGSWIRLILKLQIGYAAVEQAFRRMIFNVVGRNQDDHVKNISFLKKSRHEGWELSPAYDLTYSAGEGYTRQHQMSIDGLRDGFTREGLIAFGKKFDINHPEWIIDQTVEVFSQWRQLGNQYGVDPEDQKRVSAGHRLYLGQSTPTP
ncbi:MAG: type II toxin-antitoxin system HipA family toxin [Limnohabitans sp.]|nr:type II toxin-antitoxin system HipA family toxin [Limnohabitans sp.]